MPKAQWLWAAHLCQRSKYRTFWDVDRSTSSITPTGICLHNSDGSSVCVNLLTVIVNVLCSPCACQTTYVIEIQSREFFLDEYSRHTETCRCLTCVYQRGLALKTWKWYGPPHRDSKNQRKPNVVKWSFNSTLGISIHGQSSTCCVFYHFPLSFTQDLWRGVFRARVSFRTVSLNSR